MTDQPEALRLADWLVKVAGPWPGSSFSKNELRAAIFLQEQYAEIERLREQLRLANIDASNEAAENEALRRDAALAAAAEREACAKVCDDLELPEHYEGAWASGWSDGTDDCAAAIRARGFDVPDA